MVLIVIHGVASCLQPVVVPMSMVLLVVHSPGGARPLETPPEVREEAKTTTERKVGLSCVLYIKPRRGDTRRQTHDIRWTDIVCGHVSPLRGLMLLC